MKSCPRFPKPAVSNPSPPGDGQGAKVANAACPCQCVPSAVFDKSKPSLPGGSQGHEPIRPLSRGCIRSRGDFAEPPETTDYSHSASMNSEDSSGDGRFENKPCQRHCWRRPRRRTRHPCPPPVSDVLVGHLPSLFRVAVCFLVCVSLFTSSCQAAKKSAAESVIEDVNGKQLEKIIQEKDYVAVFWCEYIRNTSTTKTLDSSRNA